MEIQQYLRDEAIRLRNALTVSLPLGWRRIFASPRQDPQAVKRILILPCDPSAPSGSLGDVAMLAGLMQSLRKQDPDCCFTIIGTRRQQIHVTGIGRIDVVDAWTGCAGSVAFDRQLRGHKFFFALGADVMDGNYGAALVCRLVTYCNHAARLGIPVSITGFSFNSDPRRPAVHALSRLRREVKINVREKPSLERFASITGTQATLCADVAFLMPPADDSGVGVETWIQEVRNGGLSPVGVNINAHAFSELIAERGEDALITDIARELAAAAENCNLAYLLIPHDVKPMAGDTRLLSSLEEALSRCGVRAIRRVLMTDPARIKHVVGLLDLVITGRMHLAIAAIGMATPVLCITYQDKFEGLYEHFDLSPNDLIQPRQCVRPVFRASISSAVLRLDESVAAIVKNLPQVEQLSLMNIQMSLDSVWMGTGTSF